MLVPAGGTPGCGAIAERFRENGGEEAARLPGSLRYFVAGGGFLVRDYFDAFFVSDGCFVSDAFFVSMLAPVACSGSRSNPTSFQLPPSWRK